MCKYIFTYLHLRSNLQCAACEDDTEGIEQTFVSVRKGLRKYLVGGVYIPPAADL